MKQCVITSGDKGFDGLQFQDAQTPKLGEHDVLVKLHAASLNYRDLAIAKVSAHFHAG
jgi:NADPH:quinone reductase-like Zn-dependent oxidoreductase